MDAYSSLIVQQSENRLNDFRREAAQRSASRLARLIRRRRPHNKEPAPLPAPVEAAEDLRRSA